MVAGQDPAAYDSDLWLLTDIEALLGGICTNVIPIPGSPYRVYTAKPEIKRSVVLAMEGLEPRSMDLVDIFAVCTRLVIEERRLAGGIRTLMEAIGE